MGFSIATAAETGSKSRRSSQYDLTAQTAILGRRRGRQGRTIDQGNLPNQCLGGSLHGGFGIQ